MTGAEEYDANDPRLLAGDLDGDGAIGITDIAVMKGIMNGAVEYDQANRTAK